MRIVIIGPGALGCLFAAKLKLTLGSEYQIWLFDHNKQRAEILSTQGITLIDKNERSQTRVKATTNIKTIGTADLFFLCVKSHDTLKSLKQTIPLAQPDNLIIALQNGISHHAILEDIYPGPWAIGVTAQGAFMVDRRTVQHGGNGPTTIGQIKSEGRDNNLVEQAALLLNRAGIETEVSQDIRIQAWNKLIINVGINALTVLLDCRNGDILNSTNGRQRLARATLEAAAVAKEKGIAVSLDPVEMTENVCRATATNFSSMLQDIRRGRRTEIHAINGAVVKEAKRLGIPVPENAKLTNEILAIEKQAV